MVAASLEPDRPGSHHEPIVDRISAYRRRDFRGSPCDWEFSQPASYSLRPHPSSSAATNSSTPVTSRRALGILIDAKRSFRCRLITCVRARSCRRRGYLGERSRQTGISPVGAPSAGWVRRSRWPIQQCQRKLRPRCPRPGTTWCEAGHIVPWARLFCPQPKKADTTSTGQATFYVWAVGDIGMREGENEAVAYAGGIVRSGVATTRPWSSSRPKLTTFRPLTDNDRGCGHGFDRVGTDG